MTSSSDKTRVEFGALVAQTAREWRRAVDRRLQPFGLTEATWLPLLRLARAPTAMRQNELAASLALDGSSVVRLLDALQTAGLIVRREDGADRRAKAIFLTPAGRETVQRVEAVAGEVREQTLAAVPDADLATTARVLNHVCRIFAQSDAEEGA